MTKDASAKDPGTQFREILEKVARAVDGVRSLIVGDPDGLPVASLFPEAEAKTATAMASMILLAGQTAAENMELPELKDVLIEGDGWKLVVISIGDGFTLLGQFDGNVNLGLVKFYAKGLRMALQELIDELR
ncbi:MAG: roadblock/LC7 domain-containing protein [Thermoplasmata archaeon]